MKITGEFVFDTETGELRLSGSDCEREQHCFSWLVQAKTSAQQGTWLDTPSLPQVRLTFDKDGDDFVCSDITVQE